MLLGASVASVASIMSATSVVSVASIMSTTAVVVTIVITRDRIISSRSVVARLVPTMGLSWREWVAVAFNTLVTPGVEGVGKVLVPWWWLLDPVRHHIVVVLVIPLFVPVLMHGNVV
jgi:hypothetical protein